MRTNCARSGLTLTEVLCAIGITGLLLAILLPAVGASREAARRAQCVNNQRQLTLSCHAFHDTHSMLPRQNFVSVPPASMEPPGAVSAWGQLLPYFDEQNLFAQIDFNESGSGGNRAPPTSSVNNDVFEYSIPLLVGPSDNTPPGGCNMRVCLGSSAGPPYAARTGAFNSLGIRKRSATFAMITDGLSQTALISERVVGDFDPARWTPARDVAFADADVFDPDIMLDVCAAATAAAPAGHASGIGATWLLNGLSWVWYNHVAPPNWRIADCVAGGYRASDGQMTARSLHPGGVHVAFADGAVRFISNSIDIDVWRAIGTRAGSD